MSAEDDLADPASADLVPLAPSCKFLQALPGIGFGTGLAETGAPENGITDTGITPGPDFLTKLGTYLAILLETNRQFNLTAIRDPEEAWMRHIFDSLTLMGPLHDIGAKRIADVGSGGGAPGIPLAITLPQAHFTLIEATGKKARFLQRAADALGLENVTVVADRSETLGRDRRAHRERYDAVLARAVAPLAVLLELTVPLARVGGLILAIKGAKAEEEVAAAKQALYLLHTHVIDLSRTLTGTIVTMEKQRSTPKQYPRKAGEPKRAPLGAQGPPGA